MKELSSLTGRDMRRLEKIVHQLGGLRDLAKTDLVGDAVVIERAHLYSLLAPIHKKAEALMCDLRETMRAAEESAGIQAEGGAE